MQEPVISAIQQELSSNRKQVNGKSSMQILREQTAHVWTTVTTISNDVRRLIGLVEAGADVQAHLAQHRQIQDQAQELVRLRALVDELQGKIDESQQGGSFF